MEKRKIVLEVDEQGLIELTAALSMAAALMKIARDKDNDECGLYYYPLNLIRALLTEIRVQCEADDQEVRYYGGHQSSFLRGKQLFF